MKRITGKIWSHQSISTGERYYVRDVRKSSPEKVPSFPELVSAIAEIANKNRDFSLFYRGQPKDYMKPVKNGRESTVFPTFYRKLNSSLLKDERLNRAKILKEKSQIFLEEYKKMKFGGKRELEKYPELIWSILQHYEVCNTPLVDVTHSLRVAASFALNNRKASKPIILVFGLLHSSGSITYSVEQEQMLIKLLSISPPEAKRPHFQEGYLVGTFPFRPEFKKQPSYDLCVRLLAKFELSKDSFWGRDFHEIPHNALYPINDQIKNICDGIR